jgi:hypothetical protein
LILLRAPDGTRHLLKVRFPIGPQWPDAELRDQQSEYGFHADGARRKVRSRHIRPKGIDLRGKRSLVEERCRNNARADVQVRVADASYIRM